MGMTAIYLEITNIRKSEHTLERERDREREKHLIKNIEPHFGKQRKKLKN